MAMARVGAGLAAGKRHPIVEMAVRGGSLLLTGCMLLGSGTSAWAAPTVAQILQFRPKQEGVSCGTPSAQEQEACKVELDKGSGRGSGWVLRDPQGQILRRFFDSNGDNKIDVWSYYHKGNEVYRELDSNINDKIDQYRWLSQGGTRWGVDLNEDGKIDGWKMISPEEVSQEILQAVAARDWNRLQALMISEAEMKALELPAAQVQQIRDHQKQAAAKFEETCRKVGTQGGKVTWVQLILPTPHCLPAEKTGAKQDIIKHVRGTILYEAAGKHDWLQTGEMIQVGLAWRIIDAPVPGQGEDGIEGDGTRQGDVVVDPAIQPHLEELRKIDSTPPAPNATASDIVRYNLQRADVLEKIILKCKADQSEQWRRQLVDCLSAAAQNGVPADKNALLRLRAMQEHLLKAQPGSAMTAYVTYREMTATYASEIGGPPDTYGKVQEQWMNRLTKFIQDYPKAEDTSDALLQLGMVSELVGKETEAKKWYEQLVKNFPEKKPHADKAAGARKRLELEGKVLELTGPSLNGGPFDISRLRNKLVVVYYWASWNQQSVSDFARLKQILAVYGSKGIEIVCVNLDNTAADAARFLQANAPVGTQLIQTPDGVGAGLDGPLATQYGVMVLPNLFLVGTDGKVISRTVQMTTLEDEIKKATK